MPQPDLSIKITNTRSVPAEGLQITQLFYNPDDLVVPFLDGWGPLSQKPGVTLQPGQTFEQPVVGQRGARAARRSR